MRLFKKAAMVPIWGFSGNPTLSGKMETRVEIRGGHFYSCASMSFMGAIDPT